MKKKLEMDDFSLIFYLKEVLQFFYVSHTMTLHILTSTR